MNHISIYIRPPGLTKSWHLWCNVQDEGRCFKDIIQIEAADVQGEKAVLTPLRPDEDKLSYGTHDNPMIDQAGYMYCAIPFRPYEWWVGMAEKLGGEFVHHAGIPVVRVQKELHINDLLKIERAV